jgi:hypothetical protein
MVESKMIDDRLSPRRLADIESAAQEALRGNLLEQTWGRKALELVREVRALKRDLDLAAKSALDDAEETKRFRALLKAVYPLEDDRPGTEELQAQLDREVRR